MKTDFIKTKEANKSIAEVFGTEEIVKQTIDKFGEKIEGTESFKEFTKIVLNNFTKEELTILLVVYLANLEEEKKMVLSISALLDNGELEFKFEPKENEEGVTTLANCFSESTLITAGSKLVKNTNTPNNEVGIVAENIFNNMSKEEMVVALLIML